MIIAAIVCSAFAVQAATVSWGASAASAYNGQTMYLLTSIATSYADVDALEAAAVDSAKVTKSGPKYIVATRTADNDKITSTSSFYLAVLDATDGKTLHYMDVTDSMKSFVYAPPDSSPGTFTGTFAAVATSTSTVAVGVPEPTSGLLMLLGIAGLALRRRRV